MSELKSDAKRIAELVSEFLETDLGEHYLATLGVEYNGLHQEAESESLTASQKAMKIERAAGVKFAINWLTQRKTLLDGGHLKKKR